MTSPQAARIGGFLPVLDNLERALKHDDSNDLRARLRAKLRGLEPALAGAGVMPIDMAGTVFDPRGAAVGSEHVPTRRGFLLDDEPLRPAQVVVAKPK